MAINNELLAKVRDHILEEPRRYNQWVVGIESDSAPCGTAGCIYGWGAVLGDLTTPEALRKCGREENYSIFYMDEVNELFGFGDEDLRIVSCRYGELWPEPFSSQLSDAQDRGDKEGQAKAAAAYLDFIISTGRVTADES